MSERAVGLDPTQQPLTRSTARVSRSRLRRVASWVGRDVTVLGGTAVLVLLVAMAIVPGLFAPYEPTAISPPHRFDAPSGDHLFGTDQLGRDIFSRVVHATRTTLGSAILVVALAAFIGVNLGSIAGYAGRLIDEALMRTVDLFMAFPLLVLAMAIVAALGPGLVNAMTALILIWWAQYARLTRGIVLQMRDREFVTAARTIGTSPTMIIYRHILPNCFSPLLVKATLDVAVAVLVTASLSFLGLGIQPPDPDWGAMVSDGRAYVRDAWWYPTFPGLAIFVTVMALNLIGDAARDLLDPRLRIA